MNVGTLLTFAAWAMRSPAELALLQAALKTAGQPWTGDPVYARYNAPFTPWFMRRNEIWLALPD